MKILSVVFLACLALASATVYFKEEFDGDWESRWVQSDADNSAGTAGKFVATSGKYHGDADFARGVQTSEDARFYKYSRQFDSFTNADKTLVIQYSVKHEQDLDCGGSYIKLAPPGFAQQSFNGESTYNIMFGPDKCGATNKVHFIFNYKDSNHLIKKQIYPINDKLTHLYTAIINPDQTYEVRIDNEKKESGSLLDDWDFLPAKEIPDPNESKPDDWVDDKQIADPESKKPDGWDDVPKEKVDPDATKPEDWDDELDGTWEAPMIPNPDYKGEWAPVMIDNPAYKGPWIQPQIANPDYKADAHIYDYDHEYINFEIWQVKSGTIFDHILITDSLEEAEAFASGAFATEKKAEKELFDKQEEERLEKERLEREAAKEAMEAEDAAEEAVEDVEADLEADDDDDDEHDKGHDEL